MGMGGGQSVYFGDGIYFGERLSTLGNAELGWETTTSWNFGFETDFLQNRFHWEVDAYTSKTTDQIFNRQIPIMGAGIGQQSATMGQVNNWGIESSLQVNVMRKGKFSWISTLNFTMNRNKLVELYGDGLDDITNQLFLGKSLGAIYGYRFLGIVQKNDTDYIAANGAAPGDAMWANLDGSEDGRITASDREILGYNKEAFRMSLANTLTYGNWSLYFMLNGSFSGGMYGVSSNARAFIASEAMQYLSNVNHPYWTEENPSDKYPRAAYLSNGSSFIQKYGFVRLQDVSLSYDLRGTFLRKAGISGAQFYVSGKNLFFIAPNWEFSDPEVRNPGSQQLARTFTFGVNVRF
jgi:hypothetical protein